MILKSDGEFFVECDDCGDTDYGGTEKDFRQFVNSIKEDGWRILKIDDEWHHRCPTCAEGT